MSTCVSILPSNVIVRSVNFVSLSNLRETWPAIRSKVVYERTAASCWSSKMISIGSFLLSANEFRLFNAEDLLRKGFSSFGIEADLLDITIDMNQQGINQRVSVGG